jgi:hypothetical protein
MFDLKRTAQLIQGALFDSEATWRNYLPEAGDWKKTALLLTVPLIVASALIAYLLSFTGGDSSLFVQFRPTLMTTLLSMLTGAIAAGIVAFIVSALAGVFGGKNSFALGLAATSLAFVPGYLGQALTWLPWIGRLLMLGLFIYALVLLWRIIPIYLEVPQNKRAGHYVLSLLATIITMFIIGSLVGGALYGGMSGMPGSGMSGSRTEGMFGGVMRQAELVAAAEEDRYSPPDDGKLIEDQVEQYIDVMQRTSELMAEKEERLRELAEKADSNENVSLSDMTQMMTGATEMAGLNTLEIEVVKTGGGNWAEHQWVRESLRTAWMQQDTDGAVAHNFELYQKHEDQLSSYVTR